LVKKTRSGRSTKKSNKNINTLDYPYIKARKREEWIEREPDEGFDP